MSIEYRIGDVFDRLAEIPDGSIDLVVSSPPFLALRSYLPADHPDKAKEIGSEPTPAEFIDTLLALSAEFARVLAPHGSICIELGDTFSASATRESVAVDRPQDGGYDYTHPDRVKREGFGHNSITGIRNMNGKVQGGGPGWPLAKSLTGIPTLYTWSLAYGRNLLTGQASPAGQWRIRNLIVWARPNPPVGALGDKFRPATSYITVACKSARRYFDLDAVRSEVAEHTIRYPRATPGALQQEVEGRGDAGRPRATDGNPAGAPPLDWHADDHPEDGDWLWKLSTQPFSGAAKTVRWVPAEAGAAGDDIRRTTSADCPTHGGQPALAASVQGDGREAPRSTRNQRNGDHHELTLDLADAATDASPDRAGSSPDPTTVTTDPRCSDAATPRSKASSRKGRAPATTQPGTPSARTAADTARTSASPESTSQDHDTGASSTTSDGSPANPSLRTTGDIAGNPAPDETPCSCSFERRITESTSHYATFPLTLPKRLIEAMCPQRVCTTCGVPSTRITEVDAGYAAVRNVRGFDQEGRRSNDSHIPASMRSGGRGGPTAQHTTTGWTDCDCRCGRCDACDPPIIGGPWPCREKWRTGIVLDPFAGSGTTLEAAQIVGRHAIGIDLDDRNAHLAQQRVGMFLDAIDGAA